MTIETKQDVFEAVWNRLSEYRVFFNGWPREAIDEYKKRYDAALPDDLPVIPEEVGEYIRWCKSYDGIHSISEALYYATESNREWIYRAKNSDAFARAWLLGVWRVEETGEIVKLEEEK
jgi:hypothetical protein